MVSGTLVDALLSPSLAIRDLFATAVAEGRSKDFPVIVRDHFSALFAGDALDQIPVLDTAHVPDICAPMSLVRFRAMVQDTSCSPEMYISSVKDLKCGGWGLDTTEGLPEDLDLRSEFNLLKERDIIWAVSIPGQSHWCGPSRNPSATSAGSSAASIFHCKPHKFPIPDSTHVAVQLKVYDNSADSLRPTSLHEFVGVLTFESTHSEFIADVTVPTLHVLFHRELPKMLFSDSSPEAGRELGHNVRDELISWMASEALGGDTDAAEWVLLSCISSVESREPPLFPMSITLSQFAKPSSDRVPSISLALAEVLPLYFLLPCTLKLLNEETFFPESKDEDLHAGILQVPSDTTIVITETGMTEGTLAEKGLENAKVLQEVTKFQTLQYKFPFSRYPFPTDIRFITLTDGKKSLFLDSNIIVPLLSDASSDLYKGRDSMKWPSAQVLSSFREFVARAKVAKVSVGAHESEHIKNEFVQERQERGSTTVDDLTRLMTIARLIAMSRLETHMSIDSWRAAKALDSRRKARML